MAKKKSGRPREKGAKRRIVFVRVSEKQLRELKHTYRLYRKVYDWVSWSGYIRRKLGLGG